MTLKEKVTARLIRGGNNPIDVEKMVNEHFEYASRTYKSAKAIAECIRVIY